MYVSARILYAQFWKSLQTRLEEIKSLYWNRQTNLNLNSESNEFKAKWCNIYKYLKMDILVRHFYMLALIFFSCISLLLLQDFFSF